MIDILLFFEIKPQLVPNSGVHHIGMYKTHNMPVQYYNRLPKVCNADVAFVLDPVIESAETMLCVLGILKKVILMNLALGVLLRSFIFHPYILTYFLPFFPSLQQNLDRHSGAWQKFMSLWSLHLSPVLIKYLLCTPMCRLQWDR